ncbi:hypothetical protein RJ639_035640 [Escallonia herrerae]|uniref:Uncharacterized protein n=1 Tax=Escallonia herrerae TaxID=1293975 RepID=A0AA88WWA9_9ASTE|nr:hypothetical protein RJ639_035640 [Escallonia herrerae]
MKGLKQNNSYSLQGSTVTGAGATTSSFDIDFDTIKLWHMHLGHMSERGMHVLSKQGLLGSKKIEKLNFCEHCVFSKQYRVKFNQAIHTIKGTMDYIHLDLWDPSMVHSKGGGRYMLTFIDDFSRKFWVYILKKKSDVFVFIDCNDCKTPEEIWSGKHANYENLRIFGFPVYVHVNDDKLESRVKCIFLGYTSGVKGYMLRYPDSKSFRFLISKDLTFDESFMLLKKKELIDVGKDHGVREKVELELEQLDIKTAFLH